MITAGSWIVAAAAVAIFTYGQIRHAQETSKYETEDASEFLTKLGFKPEVAHHLRNQDGDGRSAGPVLASIAKELGFDLSKPEDVKRYVRYINELGGEKVSDLVEAAHGVKSNDDGSLALNDTDNAPYLSLPMDPAAFLADPFASRESQIHLTAEGRYEDPVTQMYFDPKTRQWQYFGKPGDVYEPKPAYYDTPTNTLWLEDGSLRYPEVRSLEGLRMWLVLNDYPLPK